MEHVLRKMYGPLLMGIKSNSSLAHDYSGTVGSYNNCFVATNMVQIRRIFEKNKGKDLTSWYNMVHFGRELEWGGLRAIQGNKNAYCLDIV